MSHYIQGKGNAVINKTASDTDSDEKKEDVAKSNTTYSGNVSPSEAIRSVSYSNEDFIKGIQRSGIFKEVIEEYIKNHEGAYFKDIANNTQLYEALQKAYLSASEGKTINNDPLVDAILNDPRLSFFKNSAIQIKKATGTTMAAGIEDSAVKNGRYFTLSGGDLIPGGNTLDLGYRATTQGMNTMELTQDALEARKAAKDA